MRIVAIIVVGLLCLAFAAAISAGLGFGASWVLSYFGVAVPWYVCSVALFILGSIFGSGARASS